ncbi:MAG: DUF4386 domain-containing protein [Rhodobacter sp.]|nr:DUF4386 domain-containing protein [Rhodobacter sp.]
MTSTTTTYRSAGLFYLLIILLGLGSEVLLRGGLFVAGNPTDTAANILDRTGLFRLSIAADATMVAADITVAALFYVILRPVDPLLAMLAAAFRLMQAALIAGNLMAQQTALLWLDAALPGIAPQTAAALAYQALDIHSHGYDMGLVFFGISSVLTGVLLIRAPEFPRALGYLLIAAGAVYLTGSGLRFLAPGLAGTFAPAYLIAVIAETSLAFWLLWIGGRRDAGTERPQVA